MKIRRAIRSDLALIQEWRQERAEWLCRRGSDQWSDAGLTCDEFARRVLDSIRAGQTWIAEYEGVPAATIAVDSVADPGLWTPCELEGAYVLHRMISARSVGGRGLGAVLLAHAESLALANGKNRLVLDAWTSNIHLHNYYEHHGFRHIRTVLNHATPSAALFERDVQRPGEYRTCPDAG